MCKKKKKNEKTSLWVLMRLYDYDENDHEIEK